MKLGGEQKEKKNNNIHDKLQFYLKDLKPPGRNDVPGHKTSM